MVSSWLLLPNPDSLVCSHYSHYSNHVANVNKEAHKTMMDDEAIKIVVKNDAADRVNYYE
jgi:hypothetical protein